MTLPETWGAMESLVVRGKCRAIGLSDIGLEELVPIYESARIKPAVVRSKRIRIFRKQSFWSSASRRALCSWLSLPWVTG